MKPAILIALLPLLLMATPVTAHEPQPVVWLFIYSFILNQPVMEKIPTASHEQCLSTSKQLKDGRVGVMHTACVDGVL